MHIFVTGATGFVGSAVVAELQSAGHAVTGLARSDASAAALEAAGAAVHRGHLDDLDGLRAAADAADGVIHLGFDHSFTDVPGANAQNRAAIAAFGDALEGSGRPLVVTSATAVCPGPGTVTEDDAPPPGAPNPRATAEPAVLALAERGVRASLVRLAPTVHGAGDWGFVAMLVAGARRDGVAATAGAGDNRWAAVHRSDAARLYRLAVEGAPAGARLHAVAEEGVPLAAIADAIATGLGVPRAEIGAEEALQRYGFVGRFLAVDNPTSSARTRALLGWEPTGPTLLEDLRPGGPYFAG